MGTGLTVKLSGIVVENFPIIVKYYPNIISSTILKFLQGFQKLAVFPLLLTKFSIFLKSMCLLLAIPLKFIFNQKEKRGFIWSKPFNFLFQKPSYFFQKKRAMTFNFRKIFVK